MSSHAADTGSLINLRDRCAIVGVGNTAYTRGTERTSVELHLEAASKALDDAGLSPFDVDGVMPSEMSGVDVGSPPDEVGAEAPGVAVEGQPGSEGTETVAEPATEEQ